MYLERNVAGKTTFLKLLMRFYDVTSGMILVNGVNICEIDINSYLSSITAIFQDYKIFSFTIKENITSLSLNIDDTIVDDVVEKADIKKKISTLSKGIYTYIQKKFDKEGIELSGGEQQRLAFARSLYKQSAKIIIFDEPTASLDPIAEYNLYKKYREVIQNSQNNISFFVSHRLSCVNLCNKIIMFENGKLTAYGSHDELINNNKEYKQMYEMQAKSYT